MIWVDPDAPSALDSAARVPRSVVVDPAFDWHDGDRPWYRYADTVIYEAHVKGFTMRHPEIPPQLRGTYAGLAHEAAIAHLKDLGVTTVELLPVHQNVPESFLLDRGLTNYWGYNTIGFFAPHNGYSAAVRGGRPGGQVAEFKSMVDALHRAGLEVLLDVVFNHTAEAGPDGPTLCFRGIDNAAYYRLAPGNPRDYYDTTGCGNSLNAGDPIALQLMMDSMRYWLTEMHADGFRFDLAPTLARQDGAFDKVSAFLDMVAQDPVVSRAGGGDELGRTQHGNNNAYCQDNEITWLDWARPERARDRPLPRRIRRPRPGRGRHADGRRRLPGHGQRLVGAPGMHAARYPAGRAVAGRDRQPRPRRRRGSRGAPGRR